MKNQKNYLLIIPLFILAVVSFTILGYQWLGLIQSDKENIITLDPLQENNVEVLQMGNTIEVSQNTAQSSTSEVESSSETSSTYTTDNGEFTVTSDNTLWEQYTSINIFNGLEIVAPGDSGEFYFTLSNGKDSKIEYTMSIEKFEDETLLIPLTFRLKTDEGNYIGSDEWISGDELEYVASTLSSNNNFSYILEWQWDAYADDEYDTLLGTSETLEYTMTITITATGDSESMNQPQTGDNNNIAILVVMLATSAFIFILLVLIRKKKENDDDES